MKVRLQQKLTRISFILTGLLVCVMAVATFVEYSRGTPFVLRYIYHSSWFIAFWTATAAVGAGALLCRRLPRHVMLLHVAFCMVLTGAAVSHFTAEGGRMDLRLGQITDAYEAEHGPDEAKRVEHLPFKIRLEKFRVHWHEGGSIPRKYVGDLSLYEDDGHVMRCSLAVNDVLEYRGIRFYLMGFDNDRRGIAMSLYADRWGMTISYAGYALLLLAFIGVFFSSRGAFRRLLRHPLLRRGMATAVVLLLLSAPQTLCAVPALPVDVAADFGRLSVVYNGRVCPLQTLAYDFTEKLYGTTTYEGLTPEQVLTGWLFWPEKWQEEPVLKVSSPVLRRQLGLEKYVAYKDFFKNGYCLEPLVERYYSGERKGLPAAAAEVDDRLGLIDALLEERLLKIFPSGKGEHSRWYAPAEPLPEGWPAKIGDMLPHRVFEEFRVAAVTQDYATLQQRILALKDFQKLHCAVGLPSAFMVEAERIYNVFNPITFLAYLNFAAGLLFFAVFMWGRNRRTSRYARSFHFLGSFLLCASLAALTFHITLRCLIGGRLPLSNAHETMLTIAWLTQSIALVFSRLKRFYAIGEMAVPFSFIIAGSFLLVASIGQMNPHITPLIPVLASPWMSLHVSLVMAAYSLLSFTFLCAVAAFPVRLLRKNGSNPRYRVHEESLQVMSRLMLLPALALLTAGIFVGAVWAGESWGRYWGWDPKETWALITLLVYAVPLHGESLRCFKRPMVYHTYMLLAFATVLMTYFGVNYYLTGLHSYAG